MTDKMREAFGNCSLHDGYGDAMLLEENRKWFIAGWQAAKSVPAAGRSDCTTCENRGRVNGLSQETYCNSCIFHESWRSNHYAAIREKK